jgi:5-methyltetrahydropteroyltriglutamate--homocysteine methyltransferase
VRHRGGTGAPATSRELAKESSVPRSTLYGYPRQGGNRELKKLVEQHWAGSASAAGLQAGAARLRAQRLFELREAGVDEICTNDFSLYDHVLDTAWMVGAVPARHLHDDPLASYFAMARGTSDAAPLEMTKWFDTNYHYLVPELGPSTSFAADPAKPVGEFREAASLGIATRPVLVGPVTFLLLAKSTVDGFDPLSLLDALLPAYVRVLADLAAAGAEWVQMDEPSLVQDQPDHVLAAVERAYQTLATGSPKLVVASYFGALGEALPVLARTPVDGLAMDFTVPASMEQLEALDGLPGKRLVAGVVDGRNVWINDLDRSLTTLERLRGLAAGVDVAPSCSLLHVPLDFTAETALDPAIVPWLAAARQKLDEVVLLARGLREGREAIAAQLGANRATLDDRTASPITRDTAVRARAAAVTPADVTRRNPYPVRHEAQRRRLGLPLLPTTTIGSFPQTRELRRARADRAAGRITDEAYQAVMAQEVKDVVARQEELGLDVLVHGEPERNDMVQYFAEQLAGFAATRHGWVQSYGTRYVRPPIIVGDVSRPAPMTVEWARFAQQQSSRPVKGMLTGPVTMLAWSFVRDDQPPADTARQVALALRDEVGDLEAAGIAIVQVDEPALRETLPLRRDAQADYLAWAVDAFRLATGGAADDTQVHTHMCYAEFGDVLDAIIATDADVISLEAARSDMAVVRDLAAAGYPREVGPGVWDIHSPRVPSTAEVAGLVRLAAASLPVERLWVNPDCGLKTRRYDEVLPSLEHLVAAARQVRAELG